jgi:hypothetical protein
MTRHNGFVHDTAAAWPGERMASRFRILDHYINWDSPRCDYCQVTFNAFEFPAHQAHCKGPDLTPAQQVEQWCRKQRARRAAYLREAR